MGDIDVRQCNCRMNMISKGIFQHTVQLPDEHEHYVVPAAVALQPFRDWRYAGTLLECHPYLFSATRIRTGASQRQ
jgi:hypothetical protein